MKESTKKIFEEVKEEIRKEKQDRYDRTEKLVKRDKLDLLKSCGLLGASIIAIGAGAYGTITISSGILERIAAGETLTIGSYIGTNFQLAGIGLSIIGTVAGSYGSIRSIEKIKDDASTLKYHKKDLYYLKKDLDE